MSKRIILNEVAYFGSEARLNLKEEILKRKFKKALVVSDEVLLSVGVTNMVTSLLDEWNLDYDTYVEVKPNPTMSNVTEGLDKCLNSEADYIIAIGGGSVIDCAKCISILVTNEEHRDIRSLEGAVNTKNRGLPLIALPTTAGTAAEVTINYVITDEENKKKMVCVDPNDLPILSIVDTDFLMKMPKSVAGATGMDALTHALEGYITKGSNEFSDMFHLEAIRLIYENLENACNGDRNAMDKMGMAQYIAGMGFSNVGLGIVHSMAHPLGAVYDTPHGVANALLLPFIMKFNGEGLEDRFKKIGLAFNLDMSNVDNSVDAVVDAIISLSKRLGIPQTLKEIGFKLEDIDVLSEAALNDPCTGGNPREVSVDDIKELYRKAY